MKTNIFRVREKKEKRIIIEEERTKNPFLLFLKRHKNFITLSGIMIAICLLLISTGIAFSLFRGSNDYDITYIDGDDEINTNKPDVDDDDVKDELLGEIAREEGVVVLVETFMTIKGDIISYYTDKTAVIVQSNGKIYRVSSNKKGDYGVDRNGNVDNNATKVRVEATTSTLADGTVITYYSDGSAKVEKNAENIFVRDSNNIKIENGTYFEIVNPSGVALAGEIKKVNNDTAVSFTDKTVLLTLNTKKYVTNKNTSVSSEDGTINYDRYNIFNAISEKTYEDGNTITHYENGSATITDKKGNVIYVKKSGDILLKEQQLYEIIPNEIGTSRTTINCLNGQKVTYFDNGGAVIINPGGKRQYVEDNNEIIYDSNKNIASQPNISNQISERITTDGEKVYNFDNKKSQVIKKDGTSYIIDTSKLTFLPIEEPEEELPEEEEPSHGGIPNPNPGEGIYISEAENVYNDFKNVENTTFIIKNNNNRRKILRITIQEVTDYRKYNTNRLEPQFVNFQATVGDSYIKETQLSKNTWIDSDGITNYIIYDGIINAKETSKVALSLYIDYAKLDNSHQNKGFIGTIKIYVDDESGIEN